MRIKEAACVADRDAMPYESFNDALHECVRACGGSKAVGIALWPSKGVESAQRHLLACLNADRPEKLGPEELLHLLRMARDRNCHVGMGHLCRELDYARPIVVEPPDAAAELQRQYIEAARNMAKIAERIERLSHASAVTSLRAAA